MTSSRYPDSYDKLCSTMNHNETNEVSQNENHHLRQMKKQDNKYIEDANKKKKKVQIRKKLTPLLFCKSLLAGGLAGCIAKTCIAPFERAKIIFQVSKIPFSYKRCFEKLIQTFRTEGFRALWKGNTATLLRVMPYAATQYMAFGIYGGYLAKDDYTELTPLQRFVAGAASGATATLLTYPFDFLKTRMVLQSMETTYKHIGIAIKNIYLTEGPLTFYHGLSAALIGVLPYSGISWMVMDSIRQFLQDHVNHGARATLMQRWFCGAVAAISAQTFTYPVDVVRRRMQSAVFSKTNTSQYRTLYSTIRYIYTQEGFSSFFKGVSMNWFKGPMSMGISYACFDLLQRQFGVVKI
ncbi:hypothetical protein WA158_003065 [Blastocystis sp. Blastoise]